MAGVAPLRITLLLERIIQYFFWIFVGFLADTIHACFIVSLADSNQDLSHYVSFTWIQATWTPSGIQNTYNSCSSVFHISRYVTSNPCSSPGKVVPGTPAFWDFAWTTYTSRSAQLIAKHIMIVYINSFCNLPADCQPCSIAHFLTTTDNGRMGK